MGTEVNSAIALGDTDCVVDAATVEAALDAMAAAINRDYQDRQPLVICILNGGLLPCGWLLARLTFPLEVDYLHATRYRGDTRGGDLQWLAKPYNSLRGRDIILVDDILDEGITLKAIADYCLQKGAASVGIAVLVQKDHDRRVDGIAADYLGVTVPDRYVFGCGMDIHGFWRNLPAIHAVKQDKE